MQATLKTLVATSAAAVAIGICHEARAQIDVNPPLPNVLLLVDTSGSMEYLIAPDAKGNSQLPGSVPGSACVAGTPVTTMNRWATLVSVFTGSISNFSCQATPRDSVFAAEYGLLGTAPYDKGYYLPFHRLLSNGCTPGPGVVPTNYWDWPSGAIKYHDISSTGNPCSTPFTQASDGVLDTFRDRIRFGMMTFDTLSDPGVGTSGNAPDGVTGMTGMWSYYAGWTLGSGAYKQGNPPLCAASPFEVGARNQAAPPWEGRLIPFGPGDAALLDVQTTNDHIQEALLSMRPYGATPIAGMFDDAKQFLLNDTTIDPATNKAFGPAGDAYVTGGCRKQYVILLSDGEPNMDMMPDCAANGGSCPYQQADVTASALSALPGNSQILTYVIGFAVSNPTALPAGLTSCADLDPVVHCQNPAPGLKACCQLTKIAAAGGTKHAYFADDPVSLKALLSSILAGIAAGSTARTVPVFSGVSATGAQGNASAAGYRFLARFTSDATGKLWSGDLDRERYVCTPQNGLFTPVLQVPPKASLGDDFAANLNTNSPVRQFFTFTAPQLANGLIRSDWTIRPGIVTDDGLGTYASSAPAMSLMDGPTFANTLAAKTPALGIDPAVPPQPCTTTLKTNSSSTCVNLLVRWEVGENNPSLPDTRNYAACPTPGGCSGLGAIYHSTPAVSGPPQATISDDSYALFALKNQARPVVLYTATTDGQLHAFKVAASDNNDSLKVDAQVNNELWSFLPPTVLPNLLSSYNQQALLTDGAPVVADVVFEQTRKAATTWNTVLVAGGGSAGGFYYALDVTDPKKPKFLWQLSTDTSNQHLFGRSTPKPAIATVTVPDGSDFKEVAVAILPGGTSSLLPGACVRNNTGSIIKTKLYSPRTSVHCWAGGGARSLTIVRLDTGEVLMNFRGAAGDGPAGLGSKSKIVNFTSPITGIPVAYPSGLGQVSDRIYVGDADGALWRIDLSSGDPQKWTAKLAWDAYSVSGDTDQSGQPVQTAPVLSTNVVGDTVIYYSTGEQDLLTPNASMDTRLWALVEKRNPLAASFDVSETYYRQFLGGERVTGPMALFSGVLYFSTYTPASGGAACTNGGSSFWAVDYQTGAARLPTAVPGAYKLFESFPNAIIFGVALTQTPTCSDTSCTADNFFGTNCYVNGAQGGAYGISVLVGGNSPPVLPAGSQIKADGDGVYTLPVLSPAVATRIDSWAGVIE